MMTKIDLTRPPPRRLFGPIIDAHVHFMRPAATAPLIRAARLYGISKLIGICRIDEVAPLRRRFGETVAFTVFLDHTERSDADAFVRQNVEIVRRAARLGCSGIKFWYKPEFNAKSGFYFDDPRLDPIFETMIECGLPGLVHIADPDVWWQRRYADRERFEAKRFTYRQLTNTLGRFGDLRIMVAHLGGFPEELPFLDELLSRYPNCYLDTSGTKWVARELSVKPDAARAFFIRQADRLLFGTDLVPFKTATFEHHCSRYWVHQFLYEQATFVRSPITDPDAPGPVYVAGLDLPDAVLHRIHRDNALRVFPALGRDMDLPR